MSPATELKVDPRTMWLPALPVWGMLGLALFAAWSASGILTRIEGKITAQDEHRVADREWIKEEFEEIKADFAELKARLSALEGK